MGCGSGGAMPALADGLRRLRQQFQHVARIKRGRTVAAFLPRHHTQAGVPQPHLWHCHTIHGAGAHRAMYFRFQTLDDCWHNAHLLSSQRFGVLRSKHSILYPSNPQDHSLAIGRQVRSKSFSQNAPGRKLKMPGRTPESNSYSRFQSTCRRCCHASLERIPMTVGEHYTQLSSKMQFFCNRDATLANRPVTPDSHHQGDGCR